MKNIDLNIPTMERGMQESISSFSPEVIKIFNQLPDYLKTELEKLFKHNPYFFNHCFEVSELASIVSKQNKNMFDGEEAELLKISALLHDIKKNEIDNSILNSNKPLTDEQWEKMKKHPKNALHEIHPFNKSVAEVVRDHHKHQKNAYPEGGIGETAKISRILAIIDSFHTIAHDRTYQKAMSMEECCRKLKEKFSLPEDEKIIDTLIDSAKNKINNIKG